MIVSHSNYVSMAKAGLFQVKEVNLLPSVTVPDRTLSLRQLIDRHNSGGKVKSFLPSYLGDATVVPVGFERMSLIERADFAKQLPSFIADSRGRLITLRDAIDKASREAEAAAKREDYLKLKAEFENPLVLEPNA